MLNDITLKQLNNPDPSQRKKAVMELAKTKEREALNYLATVYRSDRDPEVRELARKAGLYINKHTGGETKRKNDIGFGEYEEDDDLPSRSKGTYYEEAEPEDDHDASHVSELDKERAMGLIKQALDVHMRGNNDRAIRYMRDALKKDPTLKRDSYTTGLAATITGMPVDEAIRMLTTEVVEKDKPKRGSGRSSGGEPTWGDALVDLTIYALINLGLTALALFAVIGVLLPSISQALASAPPSSFSSSSTAFTPTPFDPTAVMSLLTGIGFGLVLLYSAIVGVVSTVGLLFQYFFIHMISVSVLAGEGTMPRLVTKSTLPLAFGYPALYLVSFGLTLYGAANPDTFGMVYLVQFGLTIAMLMWFANRIGAAYRFGTGKGCAAIVLSTVAIFMVFCICSMVLPYVFTSSSISALGF